MLNNKFSYSLVLISLFLFISACTTTTYVDEEGRMAERTGVDVQFFTKMVDTVAPIVKDALTQPEQEAAPNYAQPAYRQPSRVQPARATRRAAGRTKRGSKKSHKSSCNSNNNNRQTCY